MTKPILALVAVLALALSACGTDTPTADRGSSPTPSPTPTGMIGGGGACSLTAKQGDGGVKVTGEQTAKPAITVPAGAPPVDLLYSDLVAGTGAEVTAASTVTAHYVGISWSTRAEFDASWDGGQPATFPISGVIQGWQQGLQCMKVGGRRLLVIPPALGYGAAGYPPDIAANETLVFVVDLTAAA